MAATLTPSHARFGSSFSGSVARPDLYATESVSMADSLPSINFGFDELRERMSLFTSRFDEFIERGRKRVLEERNQFRLSVAEIQESQRARKREIENVQSKTAAHQNSLEKEAQEQEEMHEAIEELNARREDHMTRRDELKVQIAEVQRAIQKRKQAQQQHQKQLDNQARHNSPELHFWETSLCLRIEGAQQLDRLKFIYTYVDEKAWDRECWFQLSMEKREYDVLETQPVLEQEAVQEVLDRLNENRNLAEFLKAMRLLFMEAIRAS